MFSFINSKEHRAGNVLPLCCLMYTLFKSLVGVAWVAQSVKHPTWAQVIITQFVGSNPVSVSVDTSEPRACFRFCLSLFLCPSPAHTLSLSLKINVNYFFNVYLFLRDRAGEGQRERERQNPKQVQVPSCQHRT